MKIQEGGNRLRCAGIAARTCALMIVMAGMFLQARSQDRGLGLGIIIGEPTGISGKFWLSDVNAIDVGVGWTLGGYGLDKYDALSNDDSQFHIHADLLWHDYDVIQAGERFPLYYGFGARLNSGAGYNSFGVRGVGGIAWVPRSIPFDIFLEVAPVLQFNPSTRIGLNAGFGARYYL